MLNPFPDLINGGIGDTQTSGGAVVKDIDRKTYIGGNCIGAIMGLLPWKNAMQVYLEKTGLVEAEDLSDNENVWWGQEIEPVMDKRYFKATGNRPNAVSFIVHPKYPWYAGHPDRVFKDKLIEYKTTGSRHRDTWGKPGTDEVPDYVACQVAWYMGLMPEVTSADVAVLFMGGRREFVIYTIQRDDEVIETLIEFGKEFWEQHILKQIPPSLDASEATRRLLNAKYPKDIEDMLPAPEIASEWFSRLQAAKEHLAEAEQEKALAENWLKDIIGEAAGLVGPNWKATWKKSKDREEVDWKAAFNSVAQAYHLDIDQSLKRFTTIKPGPRVFRVWAKED